MRNSVALWVGFAESLSEIVPPVRRKIVKTEKIIRTLLLSKIYSRVRLLGLVRATRWALTKNTATVCHSDAAVA